MHNIVITTNFVALNLLNAEEMDYKNFEQFSQIMHFWRNIKHENGDQRFLTNKKIVDHLYSIQFNIGLGGEGNCATLILR